MIIKYYYQIGVLFDKTNPMVIVLANQQQIFSKENILNILARDGVDISKVESIRYKNKIYSGWVELSDKKPIQSEDKEIDLLLVVKEKPIINVDLYHSFEQLLKKVTAQEKKISELESKLFKTPMSQLSFQLVNSASSNLGLESQTSLELHKLNSISLQKDIIMNEESRLDFSFFYSNPLLKDTNDKQDVPLNDPIDFESEINCLVDILKGSEKKITTRFDVATYENIALVLSRRPRILHISCHGAYEVVDGESRFFLYFEDNKGKLEKFDTKKLKEVLTHTDKAGLEVVFVSACYSEPIAEVFREAGVPAVICVHSATKILDQAAQEFAKNLYKNLIDGVSLKKAFELSKRLVLYRYDKNKHKTSHCCCLHNHKPECRWIDKMEDAHTRHVKTCSCNYEESHMHRASCVWAKKIMGDNYIYDNMTSNESFIKVCCCSPEIAHDESKKFILKINENYDPIIFNNLIPGSLEIKNKNCCLNVNFSVDMKTSLIGRNVELHKVFNILCHSTNKNRMVAVYGGPGVGKNSFAKMAGKYMYERNYFPDGIHYINNRGKSFNESYFISKISSCLDLNTHNHELLQFCNKISILQMLIIINFSYTVEENIDEIRKVIKFVLEHTKSPKFLISTRKPIDIDIFENKIILEVLNYYYSAKLLYTLASEYIPPFLKNNMEILEKHDVVKLSLGNPERIHQIAGLLQENKKFENLIPMLKTENKRKENLTNDLLKLSLDKMGTKTTYVDEIIYLLYILPDGILECEISYLFIDYIEVVDVLNELSNSVIVTKSENKNIGKQIVYNLSNELLQSIENQLQIREEIKQKVFKNIICFYANLARSIVKKLYEANDNIEKATEFSAAQNEGIWLTLNKEIHSRIFKELSVKYPSKRFDFMENNVFSLLRIEKHISPLIISDEEFKESIEQLTICLPTIYKLLNKMNDCVNQYKLLLKITDEHKLELAEARLYLFKISLYPILNSSSITQSPLTTIHRDIIKAKRIFEKHKHLEGDAEASFVEGVITYEINLSNNRNGFDRISVDSFKEVHKELDQAVQKYRRASPIGLARVCYVLAEFHVSNRHYEENVYKYYEEALRIFEIREKKVLMIKSLLGIAKWYLGIHNEVKSMEYAKAAQDIGDMNKEVGQVIQYEIKEMVSEILEFIRAKSYNVFVFIKAHQLVTRTINENELLFQRSRSIELAAATTIKDLEAPVEPMINHFTNFRNKMIENFKNAKKEIHVKFDFLTENSFTEILKHMGIVLHISSDEYNDSGSLFVEGEDGESLEINYEKLKEMLINTKCSYELVIITIPRSRKLGQLFIDSGMKNVVCFDIQQDFIKLAEALPNISFFNILHDFSISMLNLLVNENTLENAFQLALREFNSQIKNIRDSIIQFNLGRDPLSDRKYANILLLPENINNNIKLFGTELTEEKVLFDGKLLDLSKIRARLHGIDKRDHAFIARKKELYELTKIIKYNSFSNLYGELGSGKTCLIKEACYFLYTRNNFKDGIFYFDISETKSIEKIKALFHESSFYSAIEENAKSNRDGKEEKRILVVFDNADKLVKYADNQLFLFLDSLNKDKVNVHYLLTSCKSITNPNINEHMQLPRLKEKEAQALFLVFVNRNIDENEIDIDPCYFEEMNNFNIINIADILGFSTRLRECNGLPKYIKRLAEVASSKSLKTINREDFLPKKLSKNEFAINSNMIPNKSKTQSYSKEVLKMAAAKTAKKPTAFTAEDRRISTLTNRENIDINVNNTFKPIVHANTLTNLHNNSMTISNNTSILKKSQNSDNDNSIISNIYHNDAPRKSINSNFSNTSSIHITTNNRSTSIPKRRSKKKRSEIQELAECEDKFTSHSEISEDEAESSEEEDPHISKYIRDINSITVINIPERKKEEEDVINTNGQIIIQNFYNSGNNNFDFSYVRNNSTNSRDSFYSQAENNPFRMTENLPFSRMKQNSLRVIEHVQSPERINKEANRERFNNDVKNKNKKKPKSGKMHAKFSKKKRNKYFTNNEEEN
jgi:hypothetical protein